MNSRFTPLAWLVAATAFLYPFAMTSKAVAGAAPVEADVCVYGGTSGGVVAAVQATRMGKSAVIVEPGEHIGGMSSGGLGWTDFGNKSAVGGMSREFYQRVGKYYGKPIEYNLEPHVAEQVFNDWVREANVRVVLRQRLAGVKREGARITEITTEDGTPVRARVFVDGTYEGDLMAKAGISCTVGREAKSTYGESLAGVQGPAKGTRAGEFATKPDPYVKPGDPASGVLPLIDPSPRGELGSADRRVQSYNYRVCLTDRPDNRIPISPPPNYDPAHFELLARWIEASAAKGERLHLSDFLKYDPLPNGKFDFNNRWPISTDYIGGSSNYAEADSATRARIAKEHEDYLRGFFHFLATSPRVPEAVRNEMGRFGLARDEFVASGNWPHQLYVRESRRMVSDFVMVEQHCRGKLTALNPVALGAYGIDIHGVRRIADSGSVENEGSNGARVPQPYPIGYGAIVPKAGECNNLFVPFCLSASHVAFGSIRMEPVFMALSQAAGTAAALAIDAGVPVQNVDYAKLRERLVADKQVLEWTASAASTRPTREAEPTRLVAYKTVGDRTLHLHIFEPRGHKPTDRRPCFVLFHGGGWGGGSPATMYVFAQHTAERGWVAISPQYRLYNKAAGVTPFECVKDARSAVRYVRAHAAELGIDPNRVAVGGHSAGGHLALATALFSDVNEDGDDLKVSTVPEALVLYGSVIDTSPEGYGTAKIGARWRELSPLHNVRPAMPPTLMFHGMADTTCPFAGARAFYEAMVKAGNRCDFEARERGIHSYHRTPENLPNTLRRTDEFLAFLSSPETRPAQTRAPVNSPAEISR